MSDKDQIHIIKQLAELGRQHRTAVREQVALTNMLKARVRECVGFENLRKGDSESLDKKKCEEAYARLLKRREDLLFLNRVKRILDPADQAQEEQNRLAKRMGELVQQLSIWEKVSKERGAGAPMLGKLIAVAHGNSRRGFADFDLPCYIWKLFGLSVVDGHAPKRTKGKKLGYSPYNRSVAWQAGDCLLKAGIRGGKPTSQWGWIYLNRKKYEQQQAKKRGLVVLPAAKIKNGMRNVISEGHIHNRAKRYMEKRFLQWLWETWNGAPNPREKERHDVAKRSGARVRIGQESINAN